MGNKTILLVEDNPDDRDLTLRALSKNHVANEVVVAEDGVEALNYLFGLNRYAGRDTRRPPAIVLLDLKLPKIDGLGVLARIRADERTKLIPVIILTSSVQEKDMLMAYQLGANSYLRKPVDFGEFMDVARQLAVYWLALNQQPPATGD